ncbi:hypothetical protein NLG97_g8145 [Lecanicillium saksenae]|uniref:Uncharacterized protein n=1 Tax=Lecanicillium saksenae TaxID=468837 RepID=A0ACC1QJR6_9HYPO|nr:hypothetical protein NLG97_g8145 [Lecanicillium saksenae]
MASRISPNTQYTNPLAQYPLDNNEYGIGVALGSPRLAPVSNQDPRRVPRVMTTITSPAAEVNEQKQQQAQQHKSTGITRQLSKRLPFLGRSKSKRRNSNGNGNGNGGNNYSRPSADLGNTNYITTPPPPVPQPSLPLPSRVEQNMARSATRPETAKLRKPMPTGMRSVTDPQMQSSGHALRQPPAWISGQPGPVLDVEIPDIKLERYSVMFSNLLEQQQATGGLLARRQATLAKIRALEDEVRREHYAELQRYRRATSPSIIPLQPSIAELPGDSPPGINVVPLRLRSNTFPMIVREAEEIPTQEQVVEEEEETAKIDRCCTPSSTNPLSSLSAALTSGTAQKKRTAPFFHHLRAAPVASHTRAAQSRHLHTP